MHSFFLSNFLKLASHLKTSIFKILHKNDPNICIYISLALHICALEFKEWRGEHLILQDIHMAANCWCTSHRKGYDGFATNIRRDHSTLDELIKVHRTKTFV